ncbi:hypothetical protein BDF22DRAFT_489555 [Syncephalis plumigaleata]|nr:hypothetical protein BDF22DRAFT_489555 [Syncephalis plumigaleata]
MVNESIAEQQPQQQQRQHISSSPLSSPLQRSPSVIPPAAVRQHNITYAWNLATRLFIVNGPFLIIYLIWSVCQLAACIIVLFITSLQHCDRPLRIFLILQLIRILIAVPLFLLIQRLRRNSLNGLEFINYDWIARINSLIDFFVLIVFVAGNYMVFTSETCQSTAPVLFYLSVAFLIIGYITLMFPVIFCLSTFFCLTCTLVVLHWIGVGKNDGAGATDEEIDNLSVLYYQPWTMDIMNNSNSNDNTVTLEENEETVGNRASIDLHTVIVDQPSDIGNTTNNTMEHRIDDDIVATVIPNNTNDNEDNALGGWLSSTMLLPRDTAAAAMTLRKTASASVSSIKQDTATVSSSTMARMESGRGFRAWFKRFKLPSSSSSSSSRQRRQRRRRQFNLLWPFHYRRWRRGTTTTTQPSSTAIPLVKLPSSIPKHNQVDGEHAICAICLCDYEWNEPIRRLHCQHHFHRDCVDPWFRVNRHCPVCKRALTWKRQQQLSSTTARWRARLSMRRGRRQQQQQQRRNSHHRQHQRSLSASVALTLQPSTMAS